MPIEGRWGRNHAANSKCNVSVMYRRFCIVRYTAKMEIRKGDCVVEHVSTSEMHVYHDDLVSPSRLRFFLEMVGEFAETHQLY